MTGQPASGIYAIINPVSRCAYIEHLRHLRRGTHKNKHLQCAWHSAFQIVVLELVQDERTALLDAEQRWMDTWPHGLYNLTPFADRPHGLTLSTEHKRRISASLTGKPKSAEAVEKMRAALTGKRGHHMSVAHKEKLRTINSSLRRSPALRARISAALTGRRASAESKSAISAGLLEHYTNHANRDRVAAHSTETWTNPDVRSRREAGIGAWARSSAGRAALTAASNARWEKHRKTR